MSYLGFDIGGANIKVSALQADGLFRLRSIKLHYPLWVRGIENLPNAIRHAINLLGDDKHDGVAVTMTAELSDVFKDKREGVNEVIKAIRSVVRDFKVITVKGQLIDPKDAVERYLDVAAANWWAVGWFASILEENCIVVDVGSTTTTITPVVNGKPSPQGLNDVEKMIVGEIVYVGSLRTPLSSVGALIPLNGAWCRVSSEYFANIGDVNRLLNHISEDEYDVETPDRRGKSIEDCHNRLSRTVCGDGKMLTLLQTKLIARFLYERAVEMIFNGLIQVLSRLASEGNLPSVAFAAGLGDFMALDAIKRAGIEGIVLRDIIGRDNSIALTSASLATYLAHSLGVDVKRWISSLK